MPVKLYLIPIVQTSPLKRSIIHPESRDADNMKMGEGGSTEPGNISGVRRYLWFVRAIWSIDICNTNPITGRASKLPGYDRMYSLPLH